MGHKVTLQINLPIVDNKPIKSMFGEVVKTVDVEMVKKVVKNCLIKLVLSISFNNCLVVTITQQLLLKMEWYYHGEEEYLVNLDMVILKTILFLLLSNLQLKYKLFKFLAVGNTLCVLALKEDYFLGAMEKMVSLVMEIQMIIYFPKKQTILKGMESKYLLLLAGTHIQAV